MTALFKNGVAYNLPPDHLQLVIEYDENNNIVNRKWDFSGGQVYQHKTYSIGMIDGGYLWENKNCEYHSYFDEGDILSTVNTQRGHC